MSRKRVAILISGGGSNMISLVRSMQADDHPAKPCLVLANRPDAGGIAKAADNGIPTAVVNHKSFAGDRARFEQALTVALQTANPDIICLAGFMRVLTANFVNTWSDRMLNIHPSLLPKYRGLNTHARALEAGDDEHGCTVHLVTPALDDGPILGQARVDVSTGDTPQTLSARVLEQEHRLYPTVLARFAAGDRTPLFL